MKYLMIDKNGNVIRVVESQSAPEVGIRSGVYYTGITDVDMAASYESAIESRIKFSIGEGGEIVPPNPTMSEIRTKRAPLLEEADIYLNKLIDSQEVDGSDLSSEIMSARAYRKSLRDLPQEHDCGADVVWPSKPWEA